MKLTIFRHLTKRHWSGLLVFGLGIFGVSDTFAADRTVNLIVSYKWVNYTGKTRRAMAVNDQIPAPILHFKDGDHVTINVFNHLDKDTAMHWHGLLIPWEMDGVEGISQKPIPPGGVFHYCFTLHQAGTYWYHAHAGLQEQQGLYGAFIIDPPQPSHYRYTKDYALVLSDWSDTNPEQILSNLKKEGDYYSSRFPLQPSLMRFIHEYGQSRSAQTHQQLVDDYKMMQQMRMSIYDIGDVAYNAFLLNGRSNLNPWTALVKVGDIVRLRFIGASASTNFHIKISDSAMKVVEVEGNAVQPYTVKDLWITPGETYDVLVRIQKNSPYIIYAESADTLGAAYGALLTYPRQPVDYQLVAHFPDPLPVTQEMMTNMGMSGMGHGSMKMDMPTEPGMIGDAIKISSSLHTDQATTTGTKYQHLVAAVKTNDPHKPINGIIQMKLFGYMDHFIWMINGLPAYKTPPIIIESGKRYRIIFTNDSMMHHPMHIHGHWFILRNGHGEYDPLLHTIDVPPGATVVADLDADATGQWFFHCHHLYHMMSGMSRIFKYQTHIDVVKNTPKPQAVFKQSSYINRPIMREDKIFPVDFSLVEHPMAHGQALYFSSFLDIGNDIAHNIQKITFRGLYGNDYNKLELFSNDAEFRKFRVENIDMDIFYWHLISQFWTVKGGVNYVYQPVSYWQPGIGIEGLMPYFIDTNIRAYYHDGTAKLDVELSRDTQFTNNFFVETGIRSILATKMVTQDKTGGGLNQLEYIIKPYYRLVPGLSLFAEYEHVSHYGRFRYILQNRGESTNENILTLGISILF